jgi:hypothetical protein
MFLKPRINTAWLQLWLAGVLANFGKGACPYLEQPC